MSRTRVAVLRGGPSSEYDVSLKSGQTVLKHLPEKYQAHDIFISKNGEWHLDGLVKSPDKILQTMDVVFNALHGEYGEDGKVQQILESHRVPYTGSNALASALAMNKYLTKETLIQHGIKTPQYFLLRGRSDPKEIAKQIFETFAPPYVIKPVALGSSVGVFVVKTLYDLPDAIAEGLLASPTILIEEGIIGKEATCGVVDNFRGEENHALMPIEIRIPKTSPFFDYHAKYSGVSEEICPGNFSREEKQEIEDVAVQAHRILGLRHYSRSDFMISPTRGVYFLETNTLPGLTSESLLPKALQAGGTSLPDFFDHILTLALEGK